VPAVRGAGGMSKVSTLPVKAQEPSVPFDQSPLLVGSTFDAMWRLAEAMAKAKSLPTHFHDSPGDCLRVVELAHRCGQSPFAIADHCFLTGGRLAMDGQGMAALINASPKIEGSLTYHYSGEGNGRQVRVGGRLRGESAVRELVVTIEQGLRDSKGARGRWLSDGDQMLAYYGARRWARRYAPEVTMGLYTRDELLAGPGAGGTTMVDVTPVTPDDGEGGGESYDSATGEISGTPAQPEPRQAKARTVKLLAADGSVLADLPSLSSYLDAFGKAWAEDHSALVHEHNLAVLDRLIDRMEHGPARSMAVGWADSLRHELDVLRQDPDVLDEGEPD